MNVMISNKLHFFGFTAAIPDLHFCILPLSLLYFSLNALQASLQICPTAILTNWFSVLINAAVLDFNVKLSCNYHMVFLPVLNVTFCIFL